MKCEGDGFFPGNIRKSRHDRMNAGLETLCPRAAGVRQLGSAAERRDIRSFCVEMTGLSWSQEAVSVA